MCKVEADGNFQQPIPSQGEILKIKAFLVVKIISKIWESFYALLNETQLLLFQKLFFYLPTYI